MLKQISSKKVGTNVVITLGFDKSLIYNASK